MDWKPIETAPKDGTPVLTYVDFATVPIVHLSFYRDIANATGNDVIAYECCGWTADETGWWTYPEHSVTQVLLNGPATPTHWCEYNSP